MQNANGLFVLLLVLLVLARAQEQKYTTKYDNVDIDAVIQNERLLASYVGCLLDNRPCTPDAAELKINLPDALENDCASCSEVQKRIADKLSHHLIDHRPDDWNILEEKYDPTGAYRERYLHSQELDREKEEQDKDKDKDMDSESDSTSTSDEDKDKGE